MDKLVHASPLSGKKILLFIPQTFNYADIISEKLKQLGAVVYYHDERSVTSTLGKALLKVNPSLFTGKTHKYYKQIIKEHRGEKFDYIFIVKCDMPDGKTLSNLKQAFPDAKMCLHLWDSIANNKNILKKIKYFDWITSFDSSDCKKGYRFKFRPLFFSDDYCWQSIGHNNYLYDIAFCGTIHSDRYKVIKEIRRQCKALGFRYYGFHFLQSKLVYRLFKLTKPEFKGTNSSDFAFDKKSSFEIADIVDKSVAVLDVQHPNQTGLTMRTIEMVGLKKKLITTNADIKEYDFYNENNICVIDRNKPEIDKEFFNTPYEDIPEEVYRKYTIEYWIYDVLGINVGEAD